MSFYKKCSEHDNTCPFSVWEVRQANEFEWVQVLTCKYNGKKCVWREANE